MSNNNLYCEVAEAISLLKSAKMLILKDKQDREDEGDIIFPAEFAESTKIAFAMREAKGLVCVALSSDYTKKFNLPPMVAENKSLFKTPFSISIEAAKGVSSGVSAKDRAITIKALLDDNSTAKDIVSPGHVFPLIAREGGVFTRKGHTEGSVDLMALSNLKTAAVICEILNDDGSVAKGKQLEDFATKHSLKIVTIEALAYYKTRYQPLIEKKSEALLPTQHGSFNCSVFGYKFDEINNYIVLKSIVQITKVPLVRVHSCCATGDIFSSKKCDCNRQLNYSLDLLGKKGGILIYAPQEGRGIGLVNKLKAYNLQEQGLNTIEANLSLGLPEDAREYLEVAQILHILGKSQIKLLTNNPLKIEELQKCGITVTQRVPIIVESFAESKTYLATKKQKMGHLL